MQVEVLYRPSYSMGIIKLQPHEQVRVESGAMVGCSQGVRIETGVTGGIMKSLSRSFLGGESFFQNTFEASESGGEVFVAPPFPGDMFYIPVAGESYVVQKGAYVASDIGVEIDTRWGGVKSMLASEGLVMLNIYGEGGVILSSYGAVHERRLEAGETFTLDTGHLVAFSDGMDYRIKRVGNIKSTILSGEGLVMEFTGPGRVMLQTRSQDAFMGWVGGGSRRR